MLRKYDRDNTSFPLFLYNTLSVWYYLLIEQNIVDIGRRKYIGLTADLRKKNLSSLFTYSANCYFYRGLFGALVSSWQLYCVGLLTWIILKQLILNQILLSKRIG
eukprot:TRINITY_DN71126_c1_g1_i1.p9 TRINITY_DN71126_c1_g1~~TRINITY_DN71126_c1_g1_i1.p9  ORF type:complete len:105 (-),score=1.66 TRINITY_DN71126_c1_g1_i1:1418-1732(-)